MDAPLPAPQDTATQEVEALRRAYEVSRFVQTRSREIRGARATSDVVQSFAEAARELVGVGFSGGHLIFGDGGERR